VAQVLRELERSARIKKEAAKKPTQQAIDQAERNATLLIEEEEREQAAQRKVRDCSTLTARRAPWHPVGWCVHRTRAERIMTHSGDGARTTG
jgi:hypothetical protein